ncbi:BlaI/MecI/CopY family transcriptional regulator [Dorea sp.]
MELTKSEADVLEILLNADKPLSKSGILDHALETKPWKDGSIHILLNSLLKKGVIYEAGFVRTGKGYGRTFAPTEKGCSYFSNLLIDITKKTEPYKIFSRLIQEGSFTDAELDELENLIKSRK